LPPHQIRTRADEEERYQHATDVAGQQRDRNEDQAEEE
jgi:hypothetical protein